MATVRDRIKRAFRLLGTHASGETPSAAEQADALEALNGMLGRWANEGLLIYARTREEFDLQANVASYTIGDSGDFDTSRPQEITNAGIKVGEQEIPIALINKDQYAAIALKDTAAEIPSHLYYNPTHPLGTITLYPKPSSAANDLVIYSEKPLTTFTSVNTTVDLPPGYQDTIDSNLAVALAPEFGKTVSEELAAMAMDSLANVKVQNSKLKENLMSVDPALVRKSNFNIYSGGSN